MKEFIVKSKRPLRAGLALAILFALTCTVTLLSASTAGAQLASLKTVPVPEPPDLGRYVRDRFAAAQLGKALFWDMQLGSDGVQACASCHFHAGADNRTKNQVNPGADGKFKLALNSSLNKTDFPLHKLANPDFQDRGLISDSDDRVSSQGIVFKEFVDIVPGQAVERSRAVPDRVYNINGVNTRRVAGRNTPSVINAIFNFSNFHDGRANNIFNGVNPFGPLDESARVFTNRNGRLNPTAVRIRNASLASQAVGPPTSDFEMSWSGRTFPKIGKKMLRLEPLAQQTVHPQDSLLGGLANSTPARRLKGLNTTYAALIRSAFRPELWSNNTQIVTYRSDGSPRVVPKPAGPLTTDQFTQMEANFSLFFGLAVQLYEATLVADDSRFDRFMEGSSFLTDPELRGMGTFQGAGSCAVCHLGPELTTASVSHVLGVEDRPGAIPNPRKNPFQSIDFMGMITGIAFYDTGFYSIGVRPESEDFGRGSTSPFENTAEAGKKLPLSFSKLAMLKFDNLLPPGVAKYTPDLPPGLLPTDTFPNPGRTGANGAIKTPHLRNVELTGPYMRNGGQVSLMDVVEFYTRGGDFPNPNNISPNIQVIGKLRESQIRKAEVVAFLLTLTDPRVANEEGPFDHPELFIPVGAAADGSDLPHRRIPEVGFSGRQSEGLPPLGTFLNVDHLRD